MLPTFDPFRTSLVAMDVAAAAHASSARLAHRREQRLRALLQAARGSAIYRPHLPDGDMTDLLLTSLPAVPKSTLMGRFEEWVTDPAIRLADLKAFMTDAGHVGAPFMGRYTVWESSGSSGEPGLFVQDEGAMAVYDAIESLRRHAPPSMRRLFDPFGLTERMVFVGAIDGHFASTVSVERLRRLNPMMAAGLHQLSFLQPMDALLSQLQDLAPTALATYPSVALLLAQARSAGLLDIHPREIWTGGETLTSAMRAEIQQAFGCPVLNTYGSSEFLSLAFECRHGQLHLNSDWAILESVDEAGRPVPAGKAGATCLLTNLANHVQPIIRYDIGDSITLHDAPCTCGSALPVLEVQGRDEATLHLGKAGSRTVDVTPLALSTVLECDAGLCDFQLVQRGPTDLLLSTTLQGKAAQDALHHARNVLGDFLTRQGARHVHIDCRCGEPGQRGRSGKIQRVISAT